MKKLNPMHILSVNLNSYKLLLNVIFIILLLNSCKHDNFKDFVGPGHCPSPSFSVTTPLNITAQVIPSIQLSTTPVVVTAEFNEAVSWTVTFKGNTSGANRIYSNNSKTVNVSWRGEPGSDVFFKNETVAIEFKIACKDAETYTRDITANNFNSYPSSGKGLLLSDFDGNGSVANTFTKPGYNASGWSSYFTLPNEITDYARLTTPLTAPQGNYYMVLKGTPGPDSWYVGGGYASVPNLGSISGATSDPSKMYVNAFINSGGNSTTLLGFTIKSGGVNYSKNINLNWTGWKMVSLKLSDFETKRGIPLTDALSVTDLTFELNPATAKGQPTEANIDFIIFTLNEPFLGK
jgi:hypothetical protein